jgi:LmbE family N-acetylglucosaminyl deacetylase
MNFKNPTAELFIPDGLGEAEALARVTRLGIGAHQDDIEFMAFAGIVACCESDTEYFAGVTCTDGAGSARSGAYAHFTGEQMRAIRRKEQNCAAQIGCYAAMIQLDYASAAVKEPPASSLHADLLEVLRATRPRIVYTHNLADKHDTHIGVAVAVIRAIRALPPGERPQAVYGCEVWRGLDWMTDAQKVVQDVGHHDALAAALNGVFESQIAGGKRYDLGVIGRRHANATFLESHAVDRTDSVAFAMDMSPLIRDDSLDIAGYVDGLIAAFREEVMAKLHDRLGR